MPTSILHPLIASVAILCIVAGTLSGAEPTPAQIRFQDFVRAQAQAINAERLPPKSAEEWRARREEIHAALERAWGGFPTEHAPLEPKILGEEQRDGYRFQKLIFQTLPGVWMTAFAYIPDGDGPFPAILSVHGHWKGAKQDPVVQSRCIGAAKLGFFVLAVDAFGAGERGLTKKLGEYHGEMVGATLFPIGRPLSGIQVYENMRAVSYLQSRPEVDGSKIGITGASGGGNQTMYAGAFDDRFGAVVPCCSVGTYDSYLTTACCMCEVVPGGLAITEEWGVLGSVAPRGLMVINATKDAFQFSVGEAQQSLGLVQPVYDVAGRPARLKHAIFDWRHDYSQPMRELMYGWMTQQLKGEGNGSPIAEPTLDVQDPERIRCFPNDTRPDDWLTLPQFAAREGRALVEAWKLPTDAGEWQSKSLALRDNLMQTTFGGMTPDIDWNARAVGTGGTEQTVTLHFNSFGIQLAAQIEYSGRPLPRTAILLNMEGAAAARQSPLARQLKDAGWDLVTLDLRATGELAWPNDTIMRAPDHNTAQWSMWIGRPLLGQWTSDVLTLIKSLDRVRRVVRPGSITVIGQGPAGVVALCAAALDADRRIDCVATVGTLASYISDVPYENQRIGIMAPGIVRDVGDIPHLAALALPRRIVIAGGVTGSGKVLSEAELQTAFQVTTTIADLTDASSAIIITEKTDDLAARLQPGE